MNVAQGESIGSAAHTWSVPRRRMAAAALFTDGADRVLLVQPSYKDVWEIPGGAVEAGESPRTTVAREVKEELGLVVNPGRIVSVDWVPPIEGRSEGMAFVYSGGVLTPECTADIRLADDELLSWAWCTVEQVHQRMRPMVARRVEASLAATHSDAFEDLEGGRPVGPAASGVATRARLLCSEA